jgi:hypothetical protein
MHVAGLAIDETRIYFDFSAQLVKRAALHSEANAVQHEPCGLLCHFQILCDLARTDTVLAIDNQPCGREPFIKGYWRVLENGPSLERELRDEYVWEELDRKIRLPVEPDALFTLRFRGSGPDQLSHFCYEADRGSMPMADMLKKFRRIFSFHQAPGLSTRPSSGAGKRSALFWFIISPLFVLPAEAESRLPNAVYLSRPEIVLDPFWALPDLTMHELSDPENFQFAPAWQQAP